MDYVICDQKETCRHAVECGGAQPHQYCSECGECPFDKEAKCVPVAKERE